jgi:peptidoglycan/xylan/chitin deacetylase (PgdA/CDA1 family)
MALTIDDGMDFFDDTLLSILDEYQIKPCCFLITRYLGNSGLMWRHQLSAIIRLTETARLQQAIRQVWPASDMAIPAPTDGASLLRATIALPHRSTSAFAQQLWDACQLPPVTEYLQQYRPYLDWERIAALRSIGFSFGSHPHTHPAFDRLSEDDAADEMQLSLDILRQQLGPGDYSFAYPFGRLPPPAMRNTLEARAGYRACFGTYGFTAPQTGARQFYQRICIEGSTESVLLAPVYPIVARINQLLGRGNSRY